MHADLVSVIHGWQTGKKILQCRRRFQLGFRNSVLFRSHTVQKSFGFRTHIVFVAESGYYPDGIVRTQKRHRGIQRVFGIIFNDTHHGVHEGNGASVLEQIQVESDVDGFGAFPGDVRIAGIRRPVAYRRIVPVEDENGEEKPLTVTEYIIDSLKEDGLHFHDALHRKILREAAEHLYDENFVAERHFVNHPDPEVSKLAADLSSDRYQLSKYHSRGQKIITDEERLYELIPRLIIDFKLSIVEEEMDHTLKMLGKPEIANAPEQCIPLMKRYKDLHEIQSMMSKKAGDRILIS